MGEHGDSSFVPWNHAYVGCKKITEIIKNNSAEVCKLDEIHQNVVNAAYEIIEKKKATYYGIGMSLSKIVKSVLDNDNSILTVSTFLKDGKYGQDDVYIGVPAVINKNGVKELAQLFKECGDAKLILEMKDKLSKKFGSPNHAGPVDVAAFMDLEDNDEIEFVKRDAYEQVKTLIENI